MAYIKPEGSSPVDLRDVPFVFSKDARVINEPLYDPNMVVSFPEDIYSVFWSYWNNDLKHQKHFVYSLYLEKAPEENKYRIMGMGAEDERYAKYFTAIDCAETIVSNANHLDATAVVLFTNPLYGTHIGESIVLAYTLNHILRDIDCVLIDTILMRPKGLTSLKKEGLYSQDMSLFL